MATPQLRDYQLRDGSVTGAKIAPGAITDSKVADLAITNAKLYGSIAGSKLAQPLTLTAPILLGDVDLTNNPQFNQWLRLKNAGQGLYNTATQHGIYFPSSDAPVDYVSGRRIGRPLLHLLNVGSGSTSSSSYLDLSGQSGVTVPYRGCALLHLSATYRASSPARPQFAFLVNGSNYDLPRVEHTSGIYFQYTAFYGFNDISGGTLTINARIRSFDANGTVTCDGGSIWVLTS